MLRLESRALNLKEHWLTEGPSRPPTLQSEEAIVYSVWGIETLHVANVRFFPPSGSVFDDFALENETVRELSNWALKFDAKSARVATKLLKEAGVPKGDATVGSSLPPSTGTPYWIDLWIPAPRLSALLDYYDRLLDVFRETAVVDLPISLPNQRLLDDVTIIWYRALTDVVTDSPSVRRGELLSLISRLVSGDLDATALPRKIKYDLVATAALAPRSDPSYDDLVTLTMHAIRLLAMPCFERAVKSARDFSVVARSGAERVVVPSVGEIRLSEDIQAYVCEQVAKYPILSERIL